MSKPPGRSLFWGGKRHVNEPMDKSQLIERIRRSRAAWEAVIAPLDDEQMVQAGVCGTWSVKDLIAHISWSEREMINVLETRALVGSELWLLPTDQRNAAIFEENKHRSLQDVRAEAREVFDTLLACLERLEEQDLHDPSRFSQMPREWQPWKVLAGNTYEHYEDHMPQVQAWLNRRPS
jgi:uncharacterized damage-inducible protein DinB